VHHRRRARQNVLKDCALPPPGHYALMARYNRWMNEKPYAICADLSDAARKHHCGKFFKSIHGALNHLLFGDVVWMAHFQQC
jgi:uncharacterized damage-inducible protein DinB